MVSVKEREAGLKARLEELQSRLHKIDDELESHQSKDWEDSAVEKETDEVLEDLGNAGLAEIEQIRAALQRVEDGTYGQCVNCGADISQERLDVLLATPFCRNCAV